MDPSSQSIISQDKLEQAALIYTLSDPFCEPIDAIRRVKASNKMAKRASKSDRNLRLLIIFADLLDMNVRTSSIESIEKVLITPDRDIKNAAILHCLDSKGELSPIEAVAKVTAMDNELKSVTRNKDLRTLAIIGSLIDKSNEPISTAKTLVNIQKLFNLENKKER